MKFYINHTPLKSEFEINHSHKIMLIGSCFAENIGDLLQEHRFKSETNPFGILFNPLSICNNLMDCIKQNPFNTNYILEKGGEYFSFLHHSSVNASSKEKLIEKINQTNQSTFNFIKDCDYLLITFGTAYYFKHIALDACVANCHKQAGNDFEKKLLSVNEITERCAKFIKELQKINPKLKIIFTVSPVKYLKDGLIENNLSKATLLLSINELTKKNKHCFYFPAYELVTDDLRDYRFYKEDLAHPNEQAIKYIWDKFSETYFSEKTKLLNEKINKLNLALNHKMLHNNAEENLKFQLHVAELSKQIKDIEPEIDL
jgi:hypothetical protein